MTSQYQIGDLVKLSSENIYPNKFNHIFVIIKIENNTKEWLYEDISIYTIKCLNSRYIMKYLKVKPNILCVLEQQIKLL